MDDLIAEFIEETSESLSLLDQELIRFEQNPQDKDILSNIFRVMHTIKGTCGFLGLPRLEKVAHAGEDVLGKFRDGELTVTSDAVSLILKCIDHIRGLLDGLSETGEEGDPTPEEEALVQELRAKAQSSDTAPPAVDEASSVAADQAVDEVPSPEGFPVAAEFLAEVEGAGQESQSAGAEVTNLHAAVTPEADVSTNQDNAPPSEAVSDAGEPATAPGQPVQKKSSPAKAATDQAESRKDKPAQSSQSIRVSVDVLENLMTMVSEMVLTRNQLFQLVRTQSESPFEEPIQRLSRVTSELQEGVMKTRMQPIGNAWKKLPRIVRDLSNDLEKNINLEMHGEDTELDRQVLELIQDPLTHMVRNSVDHGLETPADRLAAGKDEEGTIRLSAHHEGGHIIIEIADDGKGLNTEVIRGKIIEKGLATPEEVEQMDDDQVNQHIMKPGFSTAKAVTKVSGRGVGMDVVRSNIEKIGGAVEFTSTYGEGSVFTIKIPLTLAIIAALLVESGGERFAIPQIAVSEVVRISQRSDYRIESLKGSPVLRLRNRLLPLVDLSASLGLSEPHDSSEAAEHDFEGYVVVCRNGAQSIGVMVDRISDSEEIVVKPLSKIISNTTYYSGNTILGDGSVILILDTNGLATALSKDAATAAKEEENVEETTRQTESILLFKTLGPALHAVPLSSVHRIESFDMSESEVVQGDVIVQYRERMLHIHSIDGPAGISSEGRQTVLVFGSDDRAVGLAIASIEDIAEDELIVQKASRTSGLIGSGIVAKNAVDIVDPAFYLSLSAETEQLATVSQVYGEAA